MVHHGLTAQASDAKSPEEKVSGEDIQQLK
jgi:hypothetical protein